MNEREEASLSSAFGALLRRHRLAAGLSQEALAERARMSTEGVSALERGYRRSPQRETLELLAGALALDGERRRAFEKAAARSGPQRRPGGASVTVGPWSDTTASNLPFAIATFIGRERELAEVCALAREHRLVTVTGAGGVGKTQTALRVAWNFCESGENAACFIGLASTSEPSLVTAAIASALGVAQLPSRPLLETLIASLRHRTILLLLDNCEHVIGEAASTAEALLAACPNVRIIATSREPLMATGERRYQLPSLNIDDAVALFVDRAQSVDLRFALSSDNAPLVAEICRRLDGIPLAIELAAARINMLSLKALHQKLDDRLPILTGGRRTALPQQRTMRAAIDWSYELLSEQERHVFERLSIFAGGCTLTAATSVCSGDGVAQGDMLDVLASLVDKSLVTVDFERSEPRYRLLESFRQYAREKVRARGEADVLAVRHATAYLELAQWTQHEIRCGRAEAWNEVWLSEQDNWRAALQWSLVERGNVPLGQRLASEICGFEMFAPLERRRWIDTALELVDEATPPDLLAPLNRTSGTVAFHLRDYEASLASSEAALAQYRAVSDRAGVARSGMQMGYALRNLGRIPAAKTAFEEALAHARGLRPDTILANILSGLGLVTDDIEVVRGYAAEARQIHAALGNNIGVAYALINCGWCEFRAGNAEAALRHATDALYAADEAPISGTSIRVVILQNLAVYNIALARYEEAERRAREALDLARDSSQEYQVAAVLGNLAVAAALKADASAERPRARFVDAAMVLGFARSRVKVPDNLINANYERAVSVLRAAIGGAELEELLAEGALLPEEAAIAQALRG
jgi:predicted ATPase/transcriptional regulator with XRE-family HTH domain